jgi:hypothetical protein
MSAAKESDETSQPKSKAGTRTLRTASRDLQPFANPVRLKDFDLINNRACAVSELHLELGISEANLCLRLAVLKAAGKVATRRKGKRVHC